MPRGKKSTPKEFMSLVKKTDECWIWSGSRDKDGYGQFTVNYKNIRAHRYSYQYFVGDIGDKWVLHKCDNPSCVRPDHLWLGDNNDNSADRSLKGRNRDQRGLKNNMAKLTDDQIRCIFLDTRKQKEIAFDYNICQQHVSDIKTGKKRVDVTKHLKYDSQTLLPKE